MDKEARRKHLTGIAVSLPTFNDDEYNLQLDRSKAHINWLIDQGIGEGNAIVFIAGGLGEGYFLDDHEWEALANTLVEAADGRAPTGIGVFELSARRAARKAKYAADLGMDYIQCAPPPLFAAHRERDLRLTTTTSASGRTSASWHTTRPGLCRAGTASRRRL